MDNLTFVCLYRGVKQAFGASFSQSISEFLALLKNRMISSSHHFLKLISVHVYFTSYSKGSLTIYHL